MHHRKRLALITLLLLVGLVSACSLKVDRDTGLGTVTGVVKDHLGTVVSGAVVSLDGSEKTTNASGAFTFGDLEYGTYELTVDVESIRRWIGVVEVESALKAIDIELEEDVAYGNITGEVMYDTNEPAEGVLVAAGDVSTQTDANGQFVLAGLLHDEYVIVATSSSIAYDQSATLDQAEVSGINFTVPKPTNVALNKPTDASSVFTPKHVSDNAVDGIVDSQDSRWLSIEGGPHWLEIDFQGEFALDRVEVYMGNYPQSGPPWNMAVASFLIQRWHDGAWIDIPGASVTDNPDLNTHVVFEMQEPIVTDQVRFYSDVDELIRVREIEVYGVLAP